MKKIRLLIVDDSRSMRLMIRSVLGSDPAIEVVGEAADPHEARQAVKDLAPDVITLDVEMPKMNGLEFLERLMKLRPTPTVMVSDHTGKNTELTLRALEIGAVDCVAKPRVGEPLFADLADKVKAAAKVRFRPVLRPALTTEGPGVTGRFTSDGRVVGVGSSTGGVEALCALLSGYPADCPPMLITQHMPATFTKSLAKRLDGLCDATVMEAYDGAPVTKGTIYVAPGGDFHLTVSGSDNKIRCRLVRSAVVNGHRPSVDVLFQSMARALGSGAVGVILTGMGRDGAEGLLNMRRAGARTIGQDETSLIYGMPKSAFEVGAVERQLPLEKIGPAILALTQVRSETLPCRSPLPSA